MDYLLIKIIGRHLDGYFSFLGSGFELNVASINVPNEITFILERNDKDILIIKDNNQDS